MEQKEGFDSWAILELMGHRRLAGRVSEVELAGHGMLRIDIPTSEPGGGFLTQYYSPSSMYALSPTTEELARAVAKRNRPEPAHVFELPAPPKRELDNEDKCPNCPGELFFNDDGNLACHGFSGREVDGCGLVVKKKDEPATEEEPGGDAHEPV